MPKMLAGVTPGISSRRPNGLCRSDDARSLLVPLLLLSEDCAPLAAVVPVVPPNMALRSMPLGALLVDPLMDVSPPLVVLLVVLPRLARMELRLGLPAALLSVDPLLPPAAPEKLAKMELRSGLPAALLSVAPLLPPAALAKLEKIALRSGLPAVLPEEASVKGAPPTVMPVWGVPGPVTVAGPLPIAPP